MIHTDPHFKITDETLVAKLMRRAGVLDSELDDARLGKICQLFSTIPYENLTKIIKSDSVVSAASAKRLPDEFIHDYLILGTGGTCFSLTAAFIAVLDAARIEAHPILADRYYGIDTHCALVLPRQGKMLLLDPGYLLNSPVPIPISEPQLQETGINSVELAPQNAGRKVELTTIIGNDRRHRLTYKIDLVDGIRFGKAWEDSFAWEMMTYPVLTRYSNGQHHYLQGTTLRVRNGDGPHRSTLSAVQQGQAATELFGIHPTIVKKAMATLSHGKNPSP